MTPRIGIPLPTSADLEYNHRSWPQYADAVRAAGGEPVRIELSFSPTSAEVVQSCAGFVLPGSPADVDPSRYGQARGENTAPVDDAREAADRVILEHVERTGTPVLGICFGAQSLNVWLGGTLVQDLQPVPVNHGAGAQVAVAHTVLVSSMSLLGGLLSASEAPSEEGFRRLPVNSSHHQSIASPGDDLTITARCAQDGVIEAVEGLIGTAAVVGVQWHPERSYESSPASRALFMWLVSAAMDSAEGVGR